MVLRNKPFLLGLLPEYGNLKKPDFMRIIKSKKDFDMCRLQRHYIIKLTELQFIIIMKALLVIATRVSLETYWKITKDKIVFFIGNEIYQEEKIVNFSPQNMIFNSIPLDASNEKIHLLQRYCKQYTMKIWRKYQKSSCNNSYSTDFLSIL